MNNGKTTSPYGEKLAFSHSVTWLLVGDSMGARVYARHNGKPSSSSYSHSDAHHGSDLRQVMDMAWQRETYIHDASLERISELRLIHNISKRLHEARQHGLFEKLVLIAPPRMLNDLRRQLSQSVLNSVVAELPKEIICQNDPQLKGAIEAIIL